MLELHEKKIYACCLFLHWYNISVTLIEDSNWLISFTNMEHILIVLLMYNYLNSCHTFIYIITLSHLSMMERSLRFQTTNALGIWATNWKTTSKVTADQGTYP